MHTINDTLATDATAVSPATSTMQAITQHRFGTVDAWELATIPTPTITAGEVLIHVKAAGLDRGTWHMMTGRPHLIRVLGFGLRGPKNHVPGLAAAGTVVQVGTDVTRFAVGDEVYGVSGGAFAEYAVAAEEKLAHMPANVSYEQAAGVPISGTTALQAVQKAGVEAGMDVLIIGASGGVGIYAVKLANALGAKVTGVCSASKADLVRSLGADHVIDYATEAIGDGSRTYDVILDLGGNTALRTLRRALTPTGTLVIVGGESKGGVTGGFGRTLRAPIWSMFLRQRLTMLASSERSPSLEALTELLEAGTITPAVTCVYGLDQAADAMALLESGAARGKIVIMTELPGRG